MRPPKFLPVTSSSASRSQRLEIWPFWKLWSPSSSLMVPGSTVTSKRVSSGIGSFRRLAVLYLGVRSSRTLKSEFGVSMSKAWAAGSASATATATRVRRWFMICLLLWGMSPGLVPGVLLGVSALQHELPAFDLQHHYTAFVKADVVSRREVENAVRDDDLLLALQRIAQCLAEFRRAGLGLFQSQRHDALQHLERVVGVRPKLRARVGAMGLLECVHIVHRHRLDGVVGRQLFSHQHGTGRQDGAIHGLAADAHQVG